MKKFNISNGLQLAVTVCTIIAAVAGATFYLDGIGDRIDALEHKIEANAMTEEKVMEVAKVAAEEVIYDYEKKDRTIDAHDFVKGWVEQSKQMSMKEYIQHCYDNKTRVFKGGKLMIENEFETRKAMEEIYGDIVVSDLVDELIRFNPN